jgi:hypothetical protein
MGSGEEVEAGDGQIEIPQIAVFGELVDLHVTQGSVVRPPELTFEPRQQPPCRASFFASESRRPISMMSPTTCLPKVRITSACAANSTSTGVRTAMGRRHSEGSPIL